MSPHERPECRWVSFIDSEGRRRLEMRWQLPARGAHIPASAPAWARAA